MTDKPLIQFVRDGQILFQAPDDPEVYEWLYLTIEAWRYPIAMWFDRLGPSPREQGIKKA